MSIDIKELDVVLKDFDEQLESENFGLYIDAYVPPKEEAKESRSNYINRLTNNKDRNELDFSWNKNLFMV